MCFTEEVLSCMWHSLPSQHQKEKRTFYKHPIPFVSNPACYLRWSKWVHLCSHGKKSLVQWYMKIQIWRVGELFIWKGCYTALCSPMIAWCIFHAMGASHHFLRNIYRLYTLESTASFENDIEIHLLKWYVYGMYGGMIFLCKLIRSFTANMSVPIIKMAFWQQPM